MRPGDGGDPLAPGGRRLVRDVAGQVVAQGGNLVLGVVVTVLLARGLGAGDFGRWMTILAVLAIGGYLADLGLEQVAVRQASARPDEERTWVGGVAGIQVLLALPTAAVCAAVLLAVADTAAMRTASLVACASIVATSPTGVRVLFQLRVRNAAYAALQTGRGVAWGAAAIVVVWVLDGGLVALAAAFTAVAALAALAEIVLSLRLGKVRLRGSLATWAPLLRAGLPLGIASLLVLAYARIDQVLVLELAGEREAGLYGVASRVLSQIAFVPIAIATTLFPAAVALRARGTGEAAGLTTRGLETTLLASLPAAAVAVAGGGPIIAAVFGEQYRAAGPALAILLCAFVPLAVNTLATTMLFMLDRQGLVLRSALVAAAVNVGAGLLLIPSGGHHAAAWITLGTEVLMLALLLPPLARELGLDPRLDRIARVAAAALVTGAIVGAVRWAGAPDVAVLAAAVVYLPLVVALRGVTADQVGMVVGSPRGPDEP